MKYNSNAVASIRRDSYFFLTLLFKWFYLNFLHSILINWSLWEKNILVASTWILIKYSSFCNEKWVIFKRVLIFKRKLSFTSSSRSCFTSRLHIWAINYVSCMFAKQQFKEIDGIPFASLLYHSRWFIKSYSKLWRMSTTYPAIYVEMCLVFFDYIACCWMLFTIVYHDSNSYFVGW